MKKEISALIAGMGLSLTAVAQQSPRDPEFWMTLSNKTRLLVDCRKLEAGQTTMAFLAQFEPYTEDQIKALSPQQQAWLRMTRESRSTEPKMIENITRHLETAHAIKREELEAARQACLTLQK
jgi:hypothetical protein